MPKWRWTWTIEVEAENEQEAQSMVEDHLEEGMLEPEPTLFTCGTLERVED